MINPFVRLYEAPVETLTALAYLLVLAGVTYGLAGVLWNVAVRLRLVVAERQSQSFGPSWRYVPPVSATLQSNPIALGMAAFLLAAVEVALLGAMIHVLGGA